MNCFICSKEMQKDWYDGPIYQCNNNEDGHSLSCIFEDDIIFTLPNSKFEFYFILSQCFFTVTYGCACDFYIEINDMIYWKNIEKLINYTNKVITFR